MRKVRLLVFTAAILLFGGANAAPAAERISRLPPEFRQTWATPSCGNAKRAIIITRRFIFEGSRSGNVLYRQKQMRRYGDIYRIQSGDSQIANGINQTPVYDMKVAYGKLLRFELPLFVSNAAYDPFGDGYADPYVICPVPQTRYDNLSAEGFEAVRALDRIDEVCGTVPVANSTACQQTIFETFDGDGDGSLSKSELIRSYRQISFISPSQGCQIELYYPANTAMDGALFASAALSAADSDGDSQLTIYEIRDAWSQIAAIAQYQKLTPLLDNLVSLLPFLPARQAPPDFPLPSGCSCLAGVKPNL